MIGASLRAIAEEMGAALIRSAFSANIKERRDCSTALFDEHGRMVTQAEHIPVHLGAMPEAVAAVMAHDPAPGEPWILNDPYAGGTHLPDLTIVTRTELGYAVTRAHHADVGGSEPGSLPPGSRTLDEEGVVIPPTRLDDATLESLVSRMRNPDERRGDLRAQLAGTPTRGAARRRALRAARARARHRRDGRAARVLGARRPRAIRELPDGRFEGADVLETPHGLLEIRAAVTVAGDAIDIDFDGTAPQHDGNLNCPLAVTRSACFYVVRCLTAPDLPASGGAFVPVTVRAPEGCLVNARSPAAVAAGNTETSSRITDVVFDAFCQAIPVPAQGQGTMNNIVLGNDRFTYYETIGGGQGACPDADGPSAVHVAMSNTLQHAGRGARARVSAPRRALRAALRLGRQRACTAAATASSASCASSSACRLSLLSQRRATRTARRARRRGRPARPELPERRGASRDREPRPRAGRPPPDRDAGRRRLGTPGR